MKKKLLLQGKNIKCRNIIKDSEWPKNDTIKGEAVKKYRYENKNIFISDYIWDDNHLV